MSKFKEGYVAAGKLNNAGAEWGIFLAEDYPDLTAALVGTYNPESKVWELPPMTLMIFDDQGILKFCLSAKSHSRVFFGCVEDPSKVLESIDEAIRAGKGEWKARKNSRY